MPGADSPTIAYGRLRADWRFLLPSARGEFRHAVLLGAAPEHAEQMLATGLARHVSACLPRAGTADVVVVRAEALPDFNAVAQSLVRGGVLCLEVDRRSPAQAAWAPGRVMRRLQQVNLTPAGLYWAAPNLAHCRRYVPLDRPEALQWYLATLYRAGTLPYRVLEVGLRLYLRRAAHRFGLLAPCYVITAVLGQRGHQVASVLAHPALPAVLRVPGLQPVVLTSGQDAASRAVIMPFAPGSRRPAAVLKISGLPGFNTSTEQEQTTLRDLRNLLSGSLRQTIPQPLGTFEYGGLTVAVESSAAGLPLTVSSGRWGAALEQQTADLQRAARWLTGFHRQAHFGRVAWNDAAIRDWIEAPCLAFADTFGKSPAEARLFARTRECAAQLKGHTLPLVWMHYDFGPWNIYQAAEAFTVLDWEYGQRWARTRSGPALYDLLYFVTYWNHVVRRLNTEAAELRGFRHLFLDRRSADPFTRAVDAAVTEYLNDLEIDRRFVPPMLVYLWVEQALYQFARKHSLGAAPGENRRVSRATQYVALMADHVEALFAD